MSFPLTNYPRKSHHTQMSSFQSSFDAAFWIEFLKVFIVWVQRPLRRRRRRLEISHYGKLRCNGARRGEKITLILRSTFWSKSKLRDDLKLQGLRYLTITSFLGWISTAWPAKPRIRGNWQRRFANILYVIDTVNWLRLMHESRIN